MNKLVVDLEFGCCHDHDAHPKNHQKNGTVLPAITSLRSNEKLGIDGQRAKCGWS